MALAAKCTDIVKGRKVGNIENIDCAIPIPPTAK
jgi:hypothetical protein